MEATIGSVFLAAMTTAVVTGLGALPSCSCAISMVGG
jgi:hypothetical protein